MTTISLSLNPQNTELAAKAIRASLCLSPKVNAVPRVRYMRSENLDAYAANSSNGRWNTPQSVNGRSAAQVEQLRRRLAKAGKLTNRCSDVGRLGSAATLFILAPFHDEES